MLEKDKRGTLKVGKAARDLPKASGDEVRETGLLFSGSFILSAMRTSRRLLQSCVPDTSTFLLPQPRNLTCLGELHVTLPASGCFCCRRRRCFQQSCQGPKDEAFVVARRLGAGVLSGVGKRGEDWNDISISKGRPQRGQR